MSDSDKESSTPSASNTNNRSFGKHLRRRYWTSWEEMKLVEFWRRHSEEMTTTTRNEPAHVAISHEMRAQGFHVNSQECRRKIQQFINKYNSERRAIEKSNNKLASSEWNLYPLVECVLHPICSHKDIFHERNIVNRLLDKLPSTQTEDQRQQSKTFKFDNKRVSRPVGRPAKSVNKIENGYTQPQPPAIVSPTQTPTITEKLPQSVVASFSPASPAIVNVRKRNSWLSSTVAQSTKAANSAVNFRLHRFKIPRLEDLKADNIRLAERRDLALRNLYAQEREVKMLQTLVQGLQCHGK